MTIFPGAKINIGLWVVSRREDGFQDIESVFYPVGVRDACEFVLHDNGSDSDEFTQTGLPLQGSMNDNLVFRALNILRESYNLPSLRIHLHKAIPAGAGLGGGSSDAAFMLRYLNRYFRLGLCNNDLRKLAARLGSDCPFFIENRPALATGRGEILKPLKPLSPGYHILLVYPGIHIDTGMAYSMVKPFKRDHSLEDLFRNDPALWREKIGNDFEEAIIGLHPVIGEIKSTIYRSGALYSSMTGSGSTVFGIYESAPPLRLFPQYWSWRGRL